MSFPGIGQPLCVGQHGKVEDPERIQHPLPECVHLIPVCAGIARGTGT
jgi:hypothetical protein